MKQLKCFLGRSNSSAIAIDTYRKKNDLRHLFLTALYCYIVDHFYDSYDFVDS